MVETTALSIIIGGDVHYRTPQRTLCRPCYCVPLANASCTLFLSNRKCRNIGKHSPRVSTASNLMSKGWR